MRKDLAMHKYLHRGLIHAFIYASVTLTPSLAHANAHPNPYGVAMEMLIPAIVFALTMAGGGYLVLRKFEIRTWPIAVLLVAMALLFSAGAASFSIIVASLFTVYALIRGLKLIDYGVLSRRFPEKLALPKGTSSTRLIAAGLAIALTSVYLFYSSFSLVFYSTEEKYDFHMSHHLGKLVQHQLTQGKKHKEVHGFVKYPVPDRRSEDDPVLRFKNKMTYPFRIIIQKPKMKVEYIPGKNSASFKVFVYPKSFPLFPLNHLVPRYSYFADESGAIRKIKVTSPKRCPEDAPVTEQVTL